MSTAAGKGNDRTTEARDPGMFPVRVGEISSRGVERAFGPDELAAVVRDALETEPTAFRAKVTLDPPDDRKAVVAAVDLDLTWDAACDRCGEPVQVHLESTETLRYQPEDPSAAQAHDAEEVELGEDELDVGWYTDGTLSLADVVSEAIALALPMRTVCEDTPGCDARTAKLLEGSAESAGGHPGFAALKNWT